jgi:phage-related protein
VIPIEFFQLPTGKEPVKEFLEAQDPKNRSYIYRGLSLLEEFWPRLGMPHVRRIVGESGLYELRVDGHRKTYRIFFGQVNDKIILLHIIIKKSQRTPLKDIRLASERLKQYQRMEDLK